MDKFQTYFTVGAFIGLVVHVLLLVGLQRAPICDVLFTLSKLIWHVPCDLVMFIQQFVFVAVFFTDCAPILGNAWLYML